MHSDLQPDVVMRHEDVVMRHVKPATFSGRNASEHYEMGLCNCGRGMHARLSAHAAAASVTMCQRMHIVGSCSMFRMASEHGHRGGACLAVGAAKVDVGQILWEPSVVEEDIGLHNLLRQDACHAQHGPPPVLQLCLSVPAQARPPPKTLPCESVDCPQGVRVGTLLALHNCGYGKSRFQLHAGEG